MRPLVLAGWLAGAATAAQAQTPDSIQYRHQLGLTAAPRLEKFFTANQSLPVGLVYKRQIKPNQAWRVRLVGQYSRRDTTSYAGQLPGSNTLFWQVSAFAGYEWQRPLGRRLSWYCGAEVGLGLGRHATRTNREDINSQGRVESDYTYARRHWQAQLRPFLGLRWAATTRATVFVESAAVTSYSRQREGYSGETRQYYFNMPQVSVQPGSSDYTSNVTRFYWMPISLIGASFRF